MEKITWKQLKGLGWFFIVYALVRTFLSIPALALQDRNMLAVFFGTMLAVWLLFTAYRSNQALLGLSVSVLAVLIFTWLSWSDFGVAGIGFGIAGLILVTFITTIILLVKRIKKHKVWLMPLLLHGIGTVIFILLMEHLVLPAIY